MKTKRIALIAGLAVVVVAAGILGGRAIAQASIDAAAQTTLEESASPKPTASAEPSFAVPTPLPSEEAAALAGQKDGEPTVTEDNDGNETITPDWKAKAAAAHEVSGKATANVSGSGGDMDLSNGTYEGDHKVTATTSPTTTTKSSVTSSTSAPTQSTTTNSTSSDAGSHKDGEISADGKYEYWTGFGWVAIGSGSYSVPGSDAGGTELSGDKIGSMG